ncbi:hypothetical protein NL108_001362 [Boleophthalmus pectinirostris]|nr:hypothetical protein NL108_001362 [Boleophthalmus pectinirostris]
MVMQVIPLILCRTLARNIIHGQRTYVKVSSFSLKQLQLFDSLKKKQENSCTDDGPAGEVKPVTVRLASGQTLEAKAGCTTPLNIAQRARVKGALVTKVNGELWELGRPIQADCELQFLGFETPEGRQAAWRTGACVLGAVLKSDLRAQVYREGTTELGLFCDHVLKDSVLTLCDMEERCLKAAAQKLPLTRLDLSIEEVQELFQISPVTLSNQTEVSGLMRLLGVAFPGAKELEEWEREQEEARRRDHRRIGKSEYQKRGFTEVVTPTLYSTALWERSGHWEHYSENMFTVTSEGSQTYALKPMNCPAHCLMFEHRVRSWRELPLRWADFGALHRNELSGALGGLTRVRRFCQDDAHIFCTPEQLEEEIVACLEFVRSVYHVFGFTFQCLLSTRPTPCLGEPEQWDSAEEQQLERSLQHFGERWEVNPGDGAFYGPKIDIQIRDAIGRQHQCATIQLDFQLPIRFDLQYVGKDGQSHRPVMIHRAVLGSLERMIAILAENFGGKWPLWLSPAQIMVIPIGGSSESYAKQVVDQLSRGGFMVDMNDDPGATLNKKIRSAQLAQYNYIFVVGEQERETGTVNVRSRKGKQLGRRTLEEVMAALTKLRDMRSNLDDF